MSQRPEPTARQVATQYVVGFVASIFLTVVAYAAAMGYLGEVKNIVLTLLVLAVGQFIVQTVFFLHLGNEPRPRLKRLALGFMAIILVIIVGGSVWIMYHLNYNMVHFSPTEKEQYMETQYDKGF